MDTKQIHEIDLDGALLTLPGEDHSHSLSASAVCGREVYATDLAAQLEDAAARGVRVAFMPTCCEGGSVTAGLVLLFALHDFQRQGGKVVAFVTVAGSSAAWLVLGSDHVVASPRAKFGVHGSQRMGGTYDAEGFERTRRLKEALYLAGSTAPATDLRKWIGKPGHYLATEESNGHRFEAREARKLGFADEIGGRMRALEVARRFAEGKSVASVRREALAARRPEGVFSLVSAVLAADPDALRTYPNVQIGEMT
jgi:ATP-dependent protease ClpP protease subunit